MTIREMLSRMGADEWARWVAYDRIEPISPIDDYWRAALIASTIANSQPGRRRKFTIADFMPKHKGKERSEYEKMRDMFGHKIKRRRRAKSKRSRNSDPENAGRLGPASQRSTES